VAWLSADKNFDNWRLPGHGRESRSLMPTNGSTQGVSELKSTTRARQGKTEERKRRRTRRMSAAQRLAISLRMKRFWAERRKNRRAA
jgi:hypothetical protein